MPILKLVTVNGDAADLLAIYDRQLPLVQEQFPQGPPGWLSHVCAVAPEGLLHVNVWESLASSDAIAPAMQRIHERSGMPPISGVTVYPIHNLVFPTSQSPA
jgi:hypothetical protein